MSRIRIWLDDERNPNDPMVKKLFLSTGNETWVKTAEKAIALLSTGKVCELSFDHDLGCPNATGLQVANYIEQEVTQGNIPMPLWRIHSKNPVGAKAIVRAMKNTEKIVQMRRQGLIK